MEQSSEDFPLQEEGLALLTITGTGNKECTASTADRIQQHTAAFCAHQTGTNEELFQGYGSDRVSIQVLHGEIPRNQYCKN
jgi:hypothetical protein